HYGTSGRELPPTRSRLKHRPRDLLSIGAPWQLGADRESASPRSPTPLESPRPAILSSTSGSLSTSLIRSRNRLRSPSRAHNRSGDALLPLERPSSARSNQRPTRMAAFAPDMESRRDASGAKRLFGSSTAFSPACINPVTATSSSYGHSPATLC